MNKTPTVCAVMLVNGREAMARRAIKSFLAQAYPKKRLIVWDTGAKILANSTHSFPDVWFPEVDVESFRGATIGTLRNAANKFALAHYTTSDTRAEVLMHWDSDDWSHPNRIAEQVALLIDSGKECVGYRDLLFWRNTPGQFCGAWLYWNARVPVGTSLCYWRAAWEQRPFPDLPKRPGGTGEDSEWLKGVQHVTASSIEQVKTDHSGGTLGYGIAPRMIASIHGANSMPYDAETMASPSYRRAPEWDEHCRAIMAL